jgi:hypothetical protein
MPSGYRVSDPGKGLLIPLNPRSAFLNPLPQVLGAEVNQRDVFEGTVIRSAVVGVAHGISACVFAYGQTSAGKTHTMIGGLSTEPKVFFLFVPVKIWCVGHD